MKGSGQLIVGLLIGLSFAASITFAAVVWHGTGWVSDGSVIRADYMQDNLDYLKSAVDSIEAGGTIPSGFIGQFYLKACPSGWALANGTNGTPDLRGVFVRGLDLGRGIDSGRTLGSYQADDFKSHTHTPGSGVKYFLGDNANSNANGWWSNLGGSYNWPSPRFSRTGATGGTETRPDNVALLYCMKL